MHQKLKAQQEKNDIMEEKIYLQIKSKNFSGN